MYAVVQRPLAVHVSVPTCRNACSLHLRHLCRLGTSSLASSPRRLLPRLSEAAAAPALAAAAAPEPWTVLAVLAACSAGAQWLEGHTPWGAALSSPLLALLGGAAAHGLGLLPSSGPLLDVIWSYVMPLAAGLFVLEHDVTRLVSEGAPLLASFLLGAAGMVVGAALAWALVGRWMGPQGPALAACLTASYVGGTINFIATAQAVGLPAWCFPAAMAADNLAMAALLMVSLGLPLGRDNSSSSNRDTSSTGAAGHTSQGTPGSLSASSSSNHNGTDIKANSELSGGKRSNSSAAPGGSGSGQGEGHPRSEAGSRTAVHRSSSGRARGNPNADGPLATDGGALLTAVPPTAAVFAAITAAARGESRAGTGASTITPPTSATPPGSSSSGECSEAGGPVAAQQPTSVLDAPPVIPDGWWPLVPSNSSSSSSSSSSSGGGTPPDGSGATALSGDALLTAAPDPADLAEAVAAARRGASAVQRRSLSSLSSWDEGTEGGPSTTTSSSNSSMDGTSSSNSRGDRQQLWGRYAPGSPRPAAAASSGSLQRPQVLREVGLLAPDGGPLLTEDPPAGAVAAAVARARSGDTTASVSVSSTASGSFDDQDQVADTPSSSSRHSSSSSSSSSSRTDIPRRSSGKSSSSKDSNNAGQHNSSTHQSVNQDSRSMQEPVTTTGGRGTHPAPAPFTPQSAAASLAAATLSAAGARSLCAALGCPALFLMVLSLLAAGASWGAHATQAAALRHQQQQQQQQGSALVPSSVPSPFAGATALASALVGLFFAALGASCGALPDPGAAAPLLAFIAIMAGVHGAVMVGVGRGLLRLEPRVLLLGSNANIGGPATAAGLAAARGWGSLVQPALLVGALGYALGTSAGLGVAGWTGALGAAAAPAVA